MRKLLLVVVGVFVLGMSFMFSGCAKHSSTSSSSSLAFLTSKVHNWSRIEQVNTKKFSKYGNICRKDVWGDSNLDYEHYSHLQLHNMRENCVVWYKVWRKFSNTVPY